ncbi:MAG: Hsp20/alpha crystallin family protein [Deltaproteobacteria bacterium]|nr:Hsp20/alpha crystallin family protein [Deltaproteobacteria bacterium]
MALVKKWTPVKDLLFLQERMSRIFDEAFLRYSGDVSGCVWTPSADIYETEANIVIKVELPGIEIDGVDVEINENVLSLRGERKQSRDVKSEYYHIMECSYGTFQRAFILPAVVDKTGVRASFKEGVLEITIPKARPDAARQIKVDIG